MATSTSPDVVKFAKWVLDEAPKHDVAVSWGDAGPLLQYEDADTGHYFTLGQLSWRGTLTSTQRLALRVKNIGLDAAIYQDYWDKVARLTPGAKRRKFSNSSGKEWEQVAIGDSPKKDSPPLQALVTHGSAWFAAIDDAVQQIRDALAELEDE